MGLLYLLATHKSLSVSDRNMYQVLTLSLQVLTLSLQVLTSPYQLSGFGFETCCGHLNFRYRACFEQRGPGNSGNYGV